MPVTLALTVDDQQRVCARIYGALLGEPAALGSLPPITPTSNPYRLDPAGLGRRLFAAMGGANLLHLLRQESDDDTLYLDCDEAAAGLPWEYAYDPAAADFLAATHGVLRLLPQARPAPAAPAGPLVFLALAADPLVDEAGRPLTGPRLEIEHELNAIETQLHAAALEGKAIRARRVPPTSEQLRLALSRGPALLHLSCHGTVVPTAADGGPVSLLALEDPNGRLDYLRGDRLASLPPRRGLLRLVVISACQTALAARPHMGAADANPADAGAAGSPAAEGTPGAESAGTGNAGAEGDGDSGGRGDANLARALVYSGVPAAIGMQGNLPDRLSDEFAANLYAYLLAGQDLGTALRMARHALRSSPGAVGLPVAYIAPGGDAPLPLVEGAGGLAGSLRSGAGVSVPLALQPPKPLFGREADLHALACAVRRGQEDAALEAAGHNVVTVVGTGGIGKTALAAAFVQRFGWRFPGGVAGATLADLPGLSPRTLFTALLARLTGREPSQWGALDAEQLGEALLDAAASPGSLLWIDNYESVLHWLDTAQETGAESDAETGAEPGTETGAGTGHERDGERGAGADAQAAAPGPEGAAALEGEERANAAVLHRVLARLAAAGAPLLLTSRQQPAGLAGEAIFPAPQQPLDGVASEPGAALFFEHSTRATAERQAAGTQRAAAAALAQSIARQTAGHPLAIMLLAGEYDASPERPAADFAQGWAAELAAARRPGLAAHQVSFEVALRRSLDHLGPGEAAQLAVLSHFPAPFFATGAALLWTGEAPADADALAAAGRKLAVYTQRSLLRVDAWYEDGTPATYRFDPAVQRTLQRRLPDVAPAEVESRYAAYAAWLVDYAYEEAGRSPAIAQLVQQWLDELERLAPLQPDEQRVRFCWRLGVLLRRFGRIDQALAVLALGEAAGADHRLYSRLLQAKAELLVIRGELDEALRLYEKCAALNSRPDDEGERSVNLHAMANVYVRRGDLERALELYRDSLAIKEKLGDIGGKSATLHEMATVYVTRGDLERALELYRDSLAMAEKLGDIGGKSATLHAMANVYVTRGDLERALELYRDSLAIKEKLGDIGGKSATLHQMANVYVRRGDLERALELYRDSLAMAEKLGDIGGKSATLAMMANVYVRRGDLERALGLYRDSLAIQEKLGDIGGKSTTLSEMANVYAMRGEWDTAERYVVQSTELAQRLGDVRQMAFNIGKLGQIAQARGDLAAAKDRYEQALAIHERLGMPEADQVRAFLRSLEGATPGSAQPPTPAQVIAGLTRAAGDALGGKADARALAAAIERGLAELPWRDEQRAYLVALAGLVAAPAEAAVDGLAAAAAALGAANGDEEQWLVLTAVARLLDRLQRPLAAVELQEWAVDLLRTAPVARDTQEQLSILLYNLSGYLADAGQLDAAVEALEEVVALDERWQLPDAEADRAALAAMRRRRDGLPDAPAPPAPPAQPGAGALAQALRAQLAAIPPGQQAQAQAALAQFEQLSPAEQEALLAAAAQAQATAQIEEEAGAVVDAALAAAGRGEAAAVVPKLQAAAAVYAEGEAPDSPYGQLAQFTLAVAAHLAGAPPLPVPPALVERFAAFARRLAGGEIP